MIGLDRRLGIVIVVALVCSCGGAGSSSDGDAGGRGGASGAGGGAGAKDAAGDDDAGGAGGGAASTDGAGTDAPGPATIPTCAALAKLPVRTATCFVDFSAGDDAADGTTQATAWKHAPGDANATGQAKAAVLSPGQVVLFKGGVVYSGTVTVTQSGTEANPIVLEGGAQSGWGSGAAVIDGGNTRALGIGLSGASYVVVEGFEVRNFDKSQSSTGISVDGGDHDTVVGNRLHDIYYATDPTPGGTAWEQQRGTGVFVNNSPGTKVDANFVRDVGNAGIVVQADGADVQGGEVTCNEITNMNWGVAAVLGDSKPGTHLSGVAITHNYIHDFDQYYVSSVWHRDGIFVFARPDDGTLSVDDLEIAYNYFEDNTSAFGSTAWIYIEYVCRNFNVHHNILNASRSYYGVRILGDGFQVAGNHTFANNVIANQNGMGAGMHVMQSSGLQLVNNIFYDDDVGYIIATDSMDGFAADYDLLWRADMNTSVATLQAGPAEAPGGMSYDLAGLQKLGYEAHGLVADPLWSAPFAGIDADPSGFEPTAASPARDHGKMLSYTEDYAGTAIPQGAGPDIGAYEQ